MSIFLRATRAAFSYTASPLTRATNPRYFSSPVLTRIGAQHIKSPYLSSAKFSTSAHSYTKVDLRKATASSFFAGTFVGITFSQLYYSSQQSSESSPTKKVSQPRDVNKHLKAATNSSSKIRFPFVITTEQVAKALALETFDVRKVQLFYRDALVDHEFVNYPVLKITLKYSLNRDDLKSICTLLRKKNIDCRYSRGNRLHLFIEKEDVENFVRCLQNQSEQDLSYGEKPYSYLLSKIVSDREVLVSESIILPKKHSLKLYPCMDTGWRIGMASRWEERTKHLSFTLTRENIAKAFGIKKSDIRAITCSDELTVRFQTSFKDDKKMKWIVAQFEKEGVSMIKYHHYSSGDTIEVWTTNLLEFVKAFKKLLASNE
ncbi:MAG: hypothetical protein COT84_04995 [Chlamydiae bacterium CG10_big_fil_rev_8_21_14_0_10_35_9]|nr:MAG: hypothetical protein COT84_04995 [Chlamydiae bacterium CG10_big_fil_rev_8_21_14_0_10_35_9]